VAAINLVVLRQREGNPKTGETKDAYVIVEKHLLNPVYRITDKGYKAFFSEGETHPRRFVGVETTNRLPLKNAVILP